ncbi:MAG TPA: hypothetical protein VF590_08790, partial [Isosphaeraceae bacterium]
MRRILGWGIQSAVAHRPASGRRPGGEVPEDRESESAREPARARVEDEGWVGLCEILTLQDLRAGDRVLVFRDHGSALGFLRQLAADPLSLQALRATLAEVERGSVPCRATPHRVLDRLAWWLASGSLRI